MALKANYEFLFVGRDENSFLENYSYDLFKEHGENSGQIFINLEIQNNLADAEEIGTAIFETMQKVFFEDITEDPYTRFEIALKEINVVLANFRKEKMSGYIGNLNVIIAAIVGDTLFLSQSGDAEAYLIRKRYVSIVSEGLSDESGDSDNLFTSIANGNIEEGDFILFSSTRLLRYIGKNDLAKCVHRDSVDESLADVRDVISTEMLGRICLTGVLFSQATDEEIKEKEKEPDTVTKSILEGTDTEVSAEKQAVTGKFFTLFKKDRQKEPEVFEGPKSEGIGPRISGFFGGFFRGLFSKGFGKDKILAVLILVILVLVVGITVAKDRSAEQIELERLDGVLATVADKIAEAETKGAYDKEEAKKILDQAYVDAMEVFNSGLYRSKADTYLLQIEGTRDQLDDVRRIENPLILADLTEKRSDINALGFAEVNDRVFVFEYNALYEVVLDQIQDPLTIDEEEDIIAATGFDERKSVVFLTKSGKLIEYRDGTMSFMDTDEGSFHKGVALQDWSNRIYILDAVNSQIWKYSYKGTRDKFGEAEAYLASEVDLSGAKDFAIDSNIYALMDTGDIFKFYAGNKAELYINNAPFNMFTDPSVIYTDEKLDEVYVIDSQEARILVFAKDKQTGNLIYETQYLFDGINDLRDMYVDADSKKMYVLTPSQILEVGL